MTKTNLKPCPSCEGEAKFFFGMRANKGVYCSVCGVQGPSVDPEGEKWNAMPRAGDFESLKAIKALIVSSNTLMGKIYTWGYKSAGGTLPNELQDAVVEYDRVLDEVAHSPEGRKAMYV